MRIVIEVSENTEPVIIEDDGEYITVETEENGDVARHMAKALAFMEWVSKSFKSLESDREKVEAEIRDEVKH